MLTAKLETFVIQEHKYALSDDPGRGGGERGWSIAVNAVADASLMRMQM